MAQKIKVLNIISSARSGSTIFGNVLGELNGFFFAGELRNLWIKVLSENRDCGCGLPVKECNVWASILNDSGIIKLNPQSINKIMETHTRSRFIPLMLMNSQEENFRTKLKEVLDVLVKLHESILKKTNCRVIVDSSKSIAYNYLLSLLPNVDLYTVHLIRDSRGVAYSRLKTKSFDAKNNTTGEELFLQKKTPLISGIVWNVKNIFTELLQSKRKYLMVKYEDFVSEPKKIVQDVLTFMDEKSDLPFVSDTEVVINKNHAVWGNPSRFKTGVVKLKHDVEWQEKMKKPDKIFSTLLTWPLLLKYGYRV